MTEKNTSPTRVAVIGAGGIGGLVAAHLAEAGHTVTICVRTPFDRLVVERDGRTDTVDAAVLASPEGLSPVPWVLVTTKAQDTASAAPWLEKLVGAGTTVVVVQNGVGHEERVAPFVGGAPVLPALIYSGVERVSPGRIRLHTAGRITVPAGASAETFAALMQGSGIEVAPDPDFLTAVWRKVLTNTAANPVTCLTGRRVGVFREPDAFALAKALMMEAVAVGQAEGAQIGESDADKTLALHLSYNPETGTSMLYDRLAGRRLEHEYITGTIVRLAEKHDIAVPLNRAFLALLRAVDNGIRDGTIER
ncbi:2-dehydropantoate 2-reductase [Rhodovulum sp. PH10]|uniref:2-dehydropantoate 2-reductase n=1 Tax=Rhodovulum sp. PH10 TaxID=1187851 RepID=UPI00027C2913|nr:2-dehydropantoate 2-reductase [Rhodovulum sp. PH10]EJW11653.1 2-dehydropantoate 2-reductase [Rhodovulum sp. PH10]